MYEQEKLREAFLALRGPAMVYLNKSYGSKIAVQSAPAARRQSDGETSRSESTVWTIDKYREL